MSYSPSSDATFFGHSFTNSPEGIAKSPIQYGDEGGLDFNTFMFADGVGQVDLFDEHLVGETLIIRTFIFSIDGASADFSIAFDGAFLLESVAWAAGLYILPQVSELGYCKAESLLQIIDNDANDLSAFANCYRFGA